MVHSNLLEGTLNGNLRHSMTKWNRWYISYSFFFSFFLDPKQRKWQHLNPCFRRYAKFRIDLIWFRKEISNFFPGKFDECFWVKNCALSRIIWQKHILINSIYQPKSHWNPIKSKKTWYPMIKLKIRYILSWMNSSRKHVIKSWRDTSYIISMFHLSSWDRFLRVWSFFI